MNRHTCRWTTPLVFLALLTACAGDADDTTADTAAAADAAVDSAGTTPAASVEGAAAMPAGAMPANEGQEPGSFIAATETWDAVRDGIHLVLSYDEGLAAFSGMVTNNTDAAVCDVRVGVDLENGPRIGPSGGVDLEPGAASPVEIPTAGEPVEWWGAEASYQPCG